LPWQSGFVNSLFVDSKGNCAEPGSIVVRPEYCDVKTLRTLFGITQTYAYELMVKGQVKTVLLRKSGNKQTRGKRLFDVESFRSFIKRFEREELELSDSPFQRVQAARRSRLQKAKAEAGAQ
jgi:hypothetical protein